MKLLITGSNGFLGRHFVNAYKDKYSIITLSRQKADICVDLSKTQSLDEIEVDIVIHAAGKAHSIPKTEVEKNEFFDVNLEGTKNLLKNLKNVKSFVFISTVAVYGVESGENICETHALTGKTPYAKSKILAEKVLLDWSLKNSVNLLILRLPLLAAKEAPGNLGSMINAIKNRKYFSVNKGKARRSVVLVEDIVNWLPNHFGHSGIYNLSDNRDPSFADLERIISIQLGVKQPKSIPLFIARLIGFFGDILRLSFVNTAKVNKMTKSLTFSSKKAIEELSWNPRCATDHFDFIE